MASGVPWQVAGVHPQARETAQEAARRAGMSVGDWLDLAILQSARTEAALAGTGGRDGESWGQESAQQDRGFDDQPQGLLSETSGHSDPAADAPFVDIKNRLDELARELDDLDQRGNANAGREQANPRRDDRTPRQIASTLARRSAKRDPLNTNSHAANLEEIPHPDDRADHDPPAATSALSPLAQALAEIAERQRALDGEAALPHVGLPRAPTQNLGGLEQHLRGINTRLEMLQPSIDDIAIGSLRDGLADVSQMLKEATPREAIEALETEVRSLAQRTSDSRQHGPDIANLERGLAEVRDALRTLTPAEKLVGIDEMVRALSRKIDGLAATKQDTAALTKIELAIAGLRNILSTVASNEAFARLAGEVRTVAAKLDQLNSSNILAGLEQRIATIADAVQSRPQNAQKAHDVEALVLGLTNKLERLQHAGNDHAAVKHIENRITALIEKFDTSDARLDHLETIERTLADMLILLDNQRTAPPGGGEPARLPEVDTLNHEVKRTQDSIEALHSTLGLVVKRLAMIESGIRGTQATAPYGVQTLPPDYPLEPGLGIPRGNGENTPADRIADSEAALGPVRPIITSDPDGKSDFIAAARRAAQAANSQPVTRGNKLPPDARRGERSDARPTGRLDRRIRPLLVGACIALFILGSLPMLTKLFSNTDDPTIVVSEQPTHPITASAAIDAPSPASAEAQPETPTSTTRLMELFPASVPFMTTGATPRKPATPNQMTTGSVEPPNPAPAVTALPLPPARPTGGDKVTATSGSSALHIAASQGDPRAEFEVGVRYAEGRGVPQDLAAAVEWFERAAKQGLAPAQFRLGGLYEKGTGVKKDLDRARRLYLAASQSGNAKAMHNLAVLYAEGIDGKPDYATAASWFRKAADHGMADSQFNLGVLYARGIGVETNLTEAYRWFALAARSGDRESAKKRDEVGARLDQATTAAILAAVEAWIAEPQPEAATQVKAPAGGWDSAQATAKRDGGPEPKASRAAQ